MWKIGYIMFIVPLWFCSTCVPLMLMCEEKILLTQRFVLLDEEHDEGDIGNSTADNLLCNAARMKIEVMHNKNEIIAKLYSLLNSFCNHNGILL